MAGNSRLSTVEVMRTARSGFIELLSRKSSGNSLLEKMFETALFGFSGEEIKDVELVMLLVACANACNNQEFDDAKRFLIWCQFLSSRTGNTVQRVTHYFTVALLERMKHGMEVVIPKAVENQQTRLPHPAEITELLNLDVISSTLQLPCIQAVRFVGIQEIIESLGSAKRIHFIDLSICSGVHCSSLIQALADRRECPIQLLKVTAVGTTSMLSQIESVGKGLVAFAETLNVPLSFTHVTADETKHLEKEMFDISGGEFVAFYSSFALQKMKAQPNCLDSLMRVIEKIQPCVMVVIEYESNHTSPVFMDRFDEALIFYGACFDVTDETMKRCDPSRMILEAYLGQEIRDIIASKDGNMTSCHMKIEKWRECLSSFGMAEVELSGTSIFQAELVVRNFGRGNMCTLEKNGKGLIIGWKGTPKLSVSAWKFKQQETPRRRSKKP